MNSNLTAAALGLKIGLLLCLLVGCEQPAPEPTPAETVQEAIEKLPLPPPPAPESSVVTKERDLPAEIDQLTEDLGAANDKIEQVLEINERLVGVLEKLTGRIKKLEDKPDCCVMPSVSADKPAVSAPEPAQTHTNPHKSAIPKSRVEAAVEKAHDAGRNLLIVCSKPASECVWCGRLEDNVLSDTAFASAIFSSYDLLRVNVDNDPTTAKRFEVTQTPTMVVYNTDADTYHTFIPNQTVNRVLAQLGLTTPRKRLRNLLP